MLSFQTERMVAISKMRLTEGKLCEGEKPQDRMDIFDNSEETKLKVQLSYSFVFFDKLQQKNPICYIAYVKNRDRFELHWETLEPYKQMGFMSEALGAFARWMNEHTTDTDLWALIHTSNIPSIKTAEKCGFSRTEESCTGTPWYRFNLANVLK